MNINAFLSEFKVWDLINLWSDRASYSLIRCKETLLWNSEDSTFRSTQSKSRARWVIFFDLFLLSGLHIPRGNWEKAYANIRRTYKSITERPPGPNLKDGLGPGLAVRQQCWPLNHCAEHLFKMFNSLMCADCNGIIYGLQMFKYNL